MEKVIQYPEGLRLIVEHLPSFRSVAAGIWVGVGSSNENPKTNGISHFIEHMLFKGTDKLSAFDIANSFEKLGASVNAFTGKECTCYYFKSIDENSEKCLELLSSIFFDSIFEAEELRRERNVVVEEINMTEDSPEDICYDLISKANYGEHPLAQTILGSKENVLSFDKFAIEKYMQEFYVPSNIVVSIAGNITLENADKMVRKYILPKLPKGKMNSFGTTPAKMNGCFEQRIKDFEQSNIALSFPSIKFNDAKFSVQTILNTVLGGGMSSRLFQNIRERQGLAYSVYSSPSSFRNEGTMNIYLNISEINTERAIASTFEEIKKLIEQGITVEEFMRAKTQIKSACVFNQETPQTIMMSTGKLMTLANEVYDIDKRLEQVDAVTHEELNEFIKTVFQSKAIAAAYVGKKTSADIPKLLSDYTKTII